MVKNNCYLTELFVTDENDQDTKISRKFKNAFFFPKFTPKKGKKMKQGVPPVSVVDDLLDVLQKK